MSSWMYKALLVGGVLVCGLSGCAARDQANEGEAASAAFSERVTDRLAEAAERNALAVSTLAMMERTRTVPFPPSWEWAEAAPDLRGPVTMGWVGPAVEAVRQLAATAGYRFVESGARPSVPAMVVVQARERPIGEVLADIRLQLRGVDDLRVDSRARVIEYRHGRVLPTERVAVRAGASSAPEAGGRR